MESLLLFIACICTLLSWYRYIITMKKIAHYQIKPRSGFYKIFTTLFWLVVMSIIALYVYFIMGMLSSGVFVLFVGGFALVISIILYILFEVLLFTGYCSNTSGI